MGVAELEAAAAAVAGLTSAGGAVPPAALATLPPADREDEANRAGQVPSFVEVDARQNASTRSDRPRPTRKPDQDWCNDAVRGEDGPAGHALWISGGGWHDWVLRDGTARRFRVTRWYKHAMVAVDFPKWKEEFALCERKQAVLRDLGIVYICIPPGKSFTIPEMQQAIEDEREVIRTLQKTGR